MPGVIAALLCDPGAGGMWPRFCLGLSVTHGVPVAGMTVCWALWTGKDFQSHQIQPSKVAENYKPVKSTDSLESFS